MRHATEVRHKLMFAGYAGRYSPTEPYRLTTSASLSAAL